MDLALIHLILTTGFLMLVIRFVMKLFELIRARQKLVRTLSQFPGPTPHLIFGNTKEFTGSDKALAKQTEWTRDYGDIHALWFSFFWGTVRLNGPDAAKLLLNTSEPKEPQVYGFMKPWIGDGLLISTGKKWARNRRLLTPAFHFETLRPYVAVFNECAHILIDKWKKESSQNDGSACLEMFHHISLMTLDSLMKCIFGIHDDIQSEEVQNPYIRAVYDISAIFIERYKFPLYHSDFIHALSPSGYRFRKAKNTAHQFTRAVIDARMKDKKQEENGKQKNGRKYIDFVDILLDCRDADGCGLEYQEICDEVDTFMFEGHDTTASAISWFLYNLAKHPDYQDKCRDEINAVLGDRDNLEWEDLSKLPYFTQCLKESLRICPPVPGIARRITKPIKLEDGRVIPEGTSISIGVYPLHHNDRIWPDPEIYDPERFNPDNSKNRHPHAFVPFSAGPRNCIGQQFAMNELKITSAQILRNFTLSLDESTPAPRPVHEIVLRSVNGVWLRVTPRE